MALAPGRSDAAVMTLAVVGDWPPAGGADQIRIRDVLVVSFPAHLREFRDALRRHTPAWLLVGSGIDDDTAVRCLQTARERSPHVRLAMIVADADPRHQLRWVRRGCEAYLRQGLPAPDVIETLVAATRLGIVALDRTLWQAGRMQSIEVLVDLTPRENEVLALLCQGLRNAEISAAMHLAVNTIEFHLRNIFVKLGVSTRSEAVRRAMELGLA